MKQARLGSWPYPQRFPEAYLLTNSTGAGGSLGSGNRLPITVDGYSYRLVELIP